MGTIIIQIPKSFLYDFNDHLLYKNFGIRAKNKQNLETGEIDRSGLRFLDLVDYNPVYDEEYLKDLRKRTMRWLCEIDLESSLNEIREYNFSERLARTSQTFT
ncbi:MAG: hypothetical protein M0P71_05715 [Melioribacteraceae bacterium]|nr:hypothetical protein [Melioribacteraceae bacterium]